MFAVALGVVAFVGKRMSKRGAFQAVCAPFLKDGVNNRGLLEDV
jgi:hypothetical protein